MGKTQKIVGLILVLLAMGLAGYAWLLSNRMAAEQRAAQPKMLPVVVALARIQADSLIRPEMIKIAMFPSRPEGAFSDMAAVTGKIASTDIAAGEAILQERLGGGLRAMMQHIDPDERAVAIRVDEVVGVGNKLVPGDQVDVFFTLHRNNAEITDTQSRLLLEKLPVLAFGTKDIAGATAKPASEGGAPARSATETPKTAVLAVKLTDIGKLVLAAESGRLILALRPHEQPESTDVAVTVAPAPGATPANEPAAKPGAPAGRALAGTPQPLTLKQLVAMTGGKANRATGKTGRGTGSAKAGKSDGSVIVMHGLKENIVRVSTMDRTQP